MSRGRGLGLMDAPQVSEALQEDVEAVTRFFLDLRGVGHFPAPSDSQLILSWCSQAPADVVIRAIHGASTRRAGDGQPLRNLGPIKRPVQGDLRRYAGRNLGAGRGEDGGAEDEGGEEAARRMASFLDSQRALLAELEADGEADGSPGWVSLSRRIREELSGIQPGPAAVPALMTLSRAFYDGVWEILDQGAQAQLRAEAEASLEGWIRPMSEETREETLRELIVADLRARLEVLRPEALFDLWGD